MRVAKRQANCNTTNILFPPRFGRRSYTMALEAGRPVDTTTTPTLADGLAVPMVGPHAFEVARAYVDHTYLADEKDVAIACLRLIENEKLVAEGGGAIGEMSPAVTQCLRPPPMFLTPRQYNTRPRTHPAWRSPPQPREQGQDRRHPHLRWQYRHHDPGPCHRQRFGGR